MSWLSTSAMIVGAVVMAAAGFAFAATMLWISAWATGKYAWRTWRNLSGIYKMDSMRYWFKRMQDNGTHVLRKEHDDKLAAKEGGAMGDDLKGEGNART